MGFPILSAEVLRSLVSLEDLFDPVAQTLVQYSQRTVEVTPPGLLRFPAPGEAHIKSAYLHGHPFFVVKVATMFPGNRETDGKASNGFLFVCDAVTGMPVALLHDEKYLTDLRTAVTGALAARLLAPPRIHALGVFGTGGQAYWQTLAFAAIRPFETLYLWGRDPVRVEEMAQRLRLQLPHVQIITGKERKDIVAVSTVLITATASHEPLIEGTWLQPGQHITAIGADDHYKRELDGACLRRANVLIVDSRPLNDQLGDIAYALAHGEILREDVHGELGQLLNREIPGRQNEEEITIAKLIGIGVEDVAAAEFAVTKWHQQKEGGK